MQRFVSSISAYLFPVLLPFLPFLSLVTVGGGAVWEGILSAATLGIAYILAGTTLLFGFEGHKKPFLLSSLLGVPLLMVGIVSAFSTHSLVTFTSFFGQGFEFGSLGSFVLIASTIALCVYTLRNVATAFLAVISLVSAVVSLCAIFLWLGVSLFAPLTTLGTQLPFFLCAAALTTALLFDSRQPYRFTYAVVSALSFVGFFIFFNPVPAYVGIGVVLVNIVYSFRAERRLSVATFPYATAAVGVALFLSSVFGSHAPQVAVPLDIRPSLLATEYIIGPEYLSSIRTALLGTGPDSLSYAWNLYRPVEFNAGSRWNVTPDLTFSSAMTLAIEVGILGLCAFLLLPLVVLLRIISVNPHRAGVLEALYTLALFAFGSAILYSVDLPLLLIGAAALGLSFSEGHTEPRAASPGGRSSWIFRLVAAVLISTGISFALIASLQGGAAHYATQGQTMLDKNNPDGASVLFDRAGTLWPAAPYLRGASISYARKLFGRLEVGGALASDPVAARAEADTAVMLAERATAADARDFGLWLYKGSLYTSLIQFEYPDSKENARTSLGRAGLIAPKRPDVLYMRALLELALGNPQLAREDVQKALKLKSDYGDALELLQALEKSP